MRILKVVQFYYPFQDRGGPVVKVRALAHALANRGHEITVLTADLGLKKMSTATMPYAPTEWGYSAKENNIEAVYLPTVAHYRAMTLNPAVIGFSRSSLRRFDLVHFYGLYDLLGPAVSHFCRSFAKPYVVEPMGMYRPIDRGFALKRVWHRSVGQSFLGHAAKFVVTSELEEEDLLSGGVPGEKVVLRYNGIDAKAFATLPARGAFRNAHGVNANEPVLLFLGRLIPRKGADILIDAFAKACPVSGRLVVAGPEGEPGYVDGLRQRATQAGVESRVIFTGPLYDDQKLQVLADGDIFMLPSRYENFANSAAEAIACGMPVIISDRCGISSLVEGRAGLVVPAETGALVKAIEALLTDRALYQKFQQGCRAVTAELGWDRLSEQMERYYAQAMETPIATSTGTSIGSANGHH
ncbi:MAG TPA: glycosyltransferase [Candidatus Acidoferrales bacterium]